MNRQVRFLPHLNSVYLQKKSYEVHLKKMKYIQNSLHNSKNRLIKNQMTSQTHKSHSISQIEIKINNLKKNTESDYKISTIEEQQKKPSPMANSNPYTRRVEKLKKKQNQRLYKSIQNSISTLRIDKMQENYQKNQIMKKRICRFKTEQIQKQSRVKLKSQLAYRFMDKKQKGKLSEINSEISRIINVNKIQNKNFSFNNSKEGNKSTSKSDQQNFSEISKGEKSFKRDNIVLQRNKGKVQNFINRKNYEQKALVRFNSYRQSFSYKKLQGFSNSSRYLTAQKRSDQKRSDMTDQKNKCFTTQIEEPIRAANP